MKNDVPRGIMTDTTRYMVNELFSLHEFHRIVIAAHPENIKSRHIAERLHFCQEGVTGIMMDEGSFWTEFTGNPLTRLAVP